MPKKQPTAAERRHMGRVAALGCLLCDVSGRGFAEAEVHHIRPTGTGQRRVSHFLSYGLCAQCHRLDKGARHGDQTLLNVVKQDDLSLLALCIERLNEK